MPRWVPEAVALNASRDGVDTPIYDAAVEGVVVPKTHLRVLLDTADRVIDHWKDDVPDSVYAAIAAADAALAEQADA